MNEDGGAKTESCTGEVQDFFQRNLTGSIFNLSWEDIICHMLLTIIEKFSGDVF